MAVFSFGVVVCWIFTFALWGMWSFGLIVSLLLGALAGTVAMFTLLLAQRLSASLVKTQDSRQTTATQTVRADTEKAAFKS